jgi:hypothetical protein
MDMLSMALFCTAIIDKLIEFGDEGKSHADLWVRVRGAIEFLGYYPERRPDQRKKGGSDFPTYGFRGNICQLTYEQLVATQRYLEEHKKELLETKKQLFKILQNLTLSSGERRAAARYCIKLFLGLCGMYLWYSEHPPHFGPPKGVEKLCNPPEKKTKPAKA